MSNTREYRQALTVEARPDNLAAVYDFLTDKLEQAGATPAVCQQMDIAIEEIYTNIAKYAYPGQVGTATVIWQLAEPVGRLTLEFRDKGVPYDPWAREDPDITLSAEERSIGGLGLYMVKQMMDDVAYRYEDGENVITLIKEIRGR